LNEIIVGEALAGKNLVSFHVLPLRAAAVQAHPLQVPPLILARKNILNAKLLPHAQIALLSSKVE
jgi:hypothetical protein